MNSFTPQDMGWTVRLGANTRFGFRDWQEFFGDEYNWTALAPLAWSALNFADARINEPKISSGLSTKLTSWWSTPLHLLGLGLGWTAIGKGLRLWREDGYDTENDILRLIFNTYGPSIEALEYWLHTAGSFEIYPRLQALSRGEECSLGFDSSREELADHQQRLLALIPRGPRHKLTEPLISDGGYDQLHLSGHFVASVGHPQDRGQMPAPVASSERHDFHLLRLDRYQGWAIELNSHFEEAARLGASRFLRVQVDVAGLGSLGSYAFCEPTGRAFRLNNVTSHSQNELDNFERQLRWHMLGN